MSSATSIESEGGFRLKPEAKPPEKVQEDAGFRPWHFFLLASLVTATVAVMLSRQSTPAHLVLISLTIIAAGLAAAGFYRMLSPLAAPDRAMFSEPLSERARAVLQREKMLVLRSIKELEFDRSMGKLSDKDFDEMAVRLRTRAMALMKQLDEGAGGYRELIERELRARLTHAPESGLGADPSAVARSAKEEARGAKAAVRGPGSDSAAAGSGDQKAATATATLATGTCAACGTGYDEDAKFCKSCGAKL